MSDERIRTAVCDGTNDPVYERNTVDGAALAVREQRAKERVLNEARSKAHDEMRQAVAHHEFLVHACDLAGRKSREFEHRLETLEHRLETLIARDAYAAIRGDE